MEFYFPTILVDNGGDNNGPLVIMFTEFCSWILRQY